MTLHGWYQILYVHLGYVSYKKPRPHALKQSEFWLTVEWQAADLSTSHLGRSSFPKVDGVCLKLHDNKDAISFLSASLLWLLKSRVCRLQQHFLRHPCPGLLDSQNCLSEGANRSTVYSEALPRKWVVVGCLGKRLRSDEANQGDWQEPSRKNQCTCWINTSCSR